MLHKKECNDCNGWRSICKWCYLLMHIKQINMNVKSCKTNIITFNVHLLKKLSLWACYNNSELNNQATAPQLATHVDRCADNSTTVPLNLITSVKSKHSRKIKLKHTIKHNIFIHMFKQLIVIITFLIFQKHLSTLYYWDNDIYLWLLQISTAAKTMFWFAKAVILKTLPHICKIKCQFQLTHKQLGLYIKKKHQLTSISLDSND